MSIIAGSVFYETQMLVLSEIQKSDCKQRMYDAVKHVKRGRGGNLILRGTDFQLYYYNDKIVTFMLFCGKEILQDAIISLINEINDVFNKVVSVQELEEIKRQQELPTEGTQYDMEELPLQEKFGSHLEGILRGFDPQKYLADDEENKVALLKDYVCEFEKVVIDAQEEMFKREEKVQKLGEKAEDLRYDSIQYAAVTKRNVEKTICNRKMILISAGVIAFLMFYLILALNCDGLLLRACLG